MSMSVSEALEFAAEAFLTIYGRSDHTALRVLRAHIEREVDEAMVHRARDAYWDRLSEVIGGVSDGDDLDAIRAALIAALGGGK